VRVDERVPIEGGYPDERGKGRQSERLTWPHHYAIVVAAAIALAVVVTLVVGPPATLPDVALESTVLFYFERALVLVLGLLILLVVLAQAAKGNLPSEISNSGVKFPEALQAAEAAKRARAQVLGSERDRPSGEVVDADRSEAVPKSVMELRMKLEAQMAYVAKWLLRARPDSVSYATVGSLRYDGLLTEAEAEMAAHVLTLRDEELAELSPQERNEFLRDANRVVGNLRAAVFYGLVRELLTTNGLVVEDIDTPTGGRPYLLVEKDGVPYLLAPRFVMSAKKSGLFDRTRQRLRRLMRATPDEVRVIVIPDRSRRQGNADDDPQVMKLGELQNKLGLRKDPRSLA
jgi:hypothetical protein